MARGSSPPGDARWPGRHCGRRREARRTGPAPSERPQERFRRPSPQELRQAPRRGTPRVPWVLGKAGPEAPCSGHRCREPSTRCAGLRESACARARRRSRPPGPEVRRHAPKGPRSRVSGRAEHLSPGHGGPARVARVPSRGHRPRQETRREKRPRWRRRRCRRARARGAGAGS